MFGPVWYAVAAKRLRKVGSWEIWTISEPEGTAGVGPLANHRVSSLSPVYQQTKAKSYGDNNKEQIRAKMDFIHVPRGIHSCSETGGQLHRPETGALLSLLNELLTSRLGLDIPCTLLSHKAVLKGNGISKAACYLSKHQY
jgi:hypothetical protein